MKFSNNDIKIYIYKNYDFFEKNIIISANYVYLVVDFIISFLSKIKFFIIYQFYNIVLNLMKNV